MFWLDIFGKSTYSLSHLAYVQLGAIGEEPPMWLAKIQRRDYP